MTLPPIFPVEDKARKMLPVFRQLTRYFPRAFREITKVSVVNNVRYNPDREPNNINWARGKSPWQMDSALKHMMEHAVDGKVFDEVEPKAAAATGIPRIYILAQAAWRIMAELELVIEKTELEEQAKGPATGVRDPSQPIPDEGIVAMHCRCGKRLFTINKGAMSPIVFDPKDKLYHSRDSCQE